MWQRLGRVFVPDGTRPWMRTHAALPVPVRRDDTCRIYFAARDDQNRSHVGWVDVDLDDPTRVLAVAERPVLAPGPLGHFDDHGTYAASVVDMGQDGLWMYYIGWSPGVRPPLFYAAVGLAISHDGGATFVKVSPAPILQRGPHDPWMVTSPCVLRDEGRFRMWYVSGLRWEERNGDLYSYYHIKYAESTDGTDWRRDGHVALDLRPGEYHLARPLVRRVGDGYEMWYSYNPGQGYRVGYATSSDGMDWTRRDDATGIDIGPLDAWDGGMMAYPWVLRHGHHDLMFYCGNGYGRDGFGVARRPAGGIP